MSFHLVFPDILIRIHLGTVIISVLTRRAILERVWKDDLDVTDRVVDTAIRRLRDNLGEASGQIKTVIGRGYRLTEE